VTPDSLSHFELAPLFQAVGDALRQNQAAFNQADMVNGNHGDHMVEIFDLVTRAAQEKAELDLADAMLYASQLLEQITQNGSAQLYARGLAHMAAQFRSHGITLENLLPYVHKTLSEQKEAQPEGKSDDSANSGTALKALMTGLSAWEQAESGQPVSDRPLDMGVLFQFGMAYLQAKQRGGSRSEVIADAAVSVSPLSRTPYRYQSGKLAIQALLEAMQQAGGA
jgi:hypothetical protein